MPTRHIDPGLLAFLELRVEDPEAYLAAYFTPIASEKVLSPVAGLACLRGDARERAGGIRTITLSGAIPTTST